MAMMEERIGPGIPRGPACHLRPHQGDGCLPEPMPDEILAGRAGLLGQHLEVTILFADLRDFTPWVEATPVHEVVRDLGAYFAEMEQAIRAEGGFVLQFIGDEIEAAFDTQ